MKKLLAFCMAVGMYSASAQDTKMSREELETSIIKEYGLDTLKLHFELLPENNNEYRLGTYATWADSLKLNYYKIMNYAKDNNKDPKLLLNDVMKHELGHYKTDKLCEKLGLDQAMNSSYLRDILVVYTSMVISNEKNSGAYNYVLHNFIDLKLEDISKIVIYKIVDEGIATYYEDSHKEPIPITWPSSLKAIDTYSEYHSLITYTGHALVYPIISKYGDKGLEQILKNMPTKNDFENLQEYQKRMMETLEKAQ